MKKPRLFLLTVFLFGVIFGACADELVIAGPADGIRAIDEMLLSDFEIEKDCDIRWLALSEEEPTPECFSEADLILTDLSTCHSWMEKGDLTPLKKPEGLENLSEIWLGWLTDAEKEYFLPLYADWRVILSCDAADSGEREMWSGEAYFLQLAREEDGMEVLSVSPPEEGQIRLKGFVIPARKGVSDLATAFLEFMLQPFHGAYCAEMAGKLCLNEAGWDYLSAQYLENPISNPPISLLQTFTLLR